MLAAGAGAAAGAGGGAQAPSLTQSLLLLVLLLLVLLLVLPSAREGGPPVHQRSPWPAAAAAAAAAGREAAAAAAAAELVLHGEGRLGYLLGVAGGRVRRAAWERRTKMGNACKENACLNAAAVRECGLGACACVQLRAALHEPCKHAGGTRAWLPPSSRFPPATCPCLYTTPLRSMFLDVCGQSLHLSNRNWELALRSWREACSLQLLLVLQASLVYVCPAGGVLGGHSPLARRPLRPPCALLRSLLPAAK